MDYMKHLDVCYNKPIFLTMATVGDDLYWQLIENFVYTMVFPHSLTHSLTSYRSDSSIISFIRSNLMYPNAVLLSVCPTPFV